MQVVQLATVTATGEPRVAPVCASYTEIHGEGWESFRRGNPYWRIEPAKLFTFGGWGSAPPA